MDALVGRKPTFHDACSLWMALVQGYEEDLQERRRLGQGLDENTRLQQHAFRDQSISSLLSKLERTKPVSGKDGTSLAQIAAVNPKKGLLAH